MPATWGALTVEAQIEGLGPFDDSVLSPGKRSEGYEGVGHTVYLTEPV